MNRREFLEGSLGAVVAAGAMAGRAGAGEAPDDGLISPRQAKLAVRPVMTNMVHTGVWEGPCRWRAIGVDQERANAEARFAGWPKQLAARLGQQPGVELLPAVHVTFDEQFKLTAEQAAKLTRDGRAPDVLFISPGGASVIAYDVARRLEKPMILEWGLNCRTVDIASYARSMGVETFVPAGDEELRKLLVLLRARKVFRETAVLFPTDRGLPPVASVSSINDLADLEKRHGVRVVQIGYKELAAEMDRALGADAERAKAEEVADRLVRGAAHSYLDKGLVARCVQFCHTARKLMARHKCNAFTIECFEFCSSRLPERWKITPCLTHTMLKDEGFASSCEADLGGLLSMRLLMSVSGKSSHLGNTFLRPGGLLAINHSASGLRLNGFDQPGLPYKLGRFVSSGWGAKAVVDFTNNEEKRATVVRIDPTASRMLVLRGTLEGSDGWEGDNLGCSVEARIKPVEGRAEDFVRKQLDYGNHLIWTYGHYADEMRQLGEMLGMEVEVVG